MRNVDFDTLNNALLFLESLSPERNPRMVSSFLVVFQLLIACIGQLINIVALHEALVSHRILRVLRLNGIREIVAMGDVIDEVLRFGSHALILTASIYLLTDDSSDMIRWYNRWALILITVLLAVSSINRLVTRRKVIQIMELTENTPRRRVGDIG
jgi:hypothetical protein